MIARTHVVLLGLLLFSAMMKVCPAQPRPPQENPVRGAADYSPPVFLSPDRSSLRLLTTAEALIDQGRYSQAVRLLQKVLGEETNPVRNEDYFFAPSGNRRLQGEAAQSLKRAARQMLGDLPTVARDSYELQYGGRAKRMLEQAVNRSDIEAVADVQRRYFHTDAGYQAMLLLAYHYLNQGNPHRAVLCFQQVAESPGAADYEPELSLLHAIALYRAGRLTEAESILSKLLASRPTETWKTETWKIADSAVPLPAADESWSDWLDRWAGGMLAPSLISDWVMFRGNATRTASSSPSRPLMLRPLWGQRVSTDMHQEKLIASLAGGHIDRAVVAIPAMQPLAVGETVLMRTPERVVAVDFESGKIVWQIETRPTEVGFSGSQPRFIPGRSDDPTSLAAVATLLTEQVWMDKTRGSMSSDGDRVFLLEEFNHKNEWKYVDPQGRRRILPGPHYNVLRARSISQEEGKLLWSLGGPHDADAEMRTAFFLGPPLAVDGKLYQIVELADEVRLLVLDAETGKRLWQQQLAVIRQLSQYERPRRIGGISPSYDRGILVCPTGAGALVAVDLTSRNLRWGYAYGEIENRGSRQRPAWRQQVLAVSPRVEQVWADACALIADDRVLITPTESDQLHCLALDSGKLLWKRDRGDDVFLACVYDGKAILVGPEQLTAIAMHSGEELNRCQLPESGAVPSGRGYDAEGRYYLPVQTPDGGAVLTIDLDSMEIVETTEVRGGQIPGNLICHRDCVISQSSDALQCFFQYRALESQIAKALEEDDTDPEALLRQGEILFDRGLSVDAVALFRRAATAFSKRAETFLAKGESERHTEALATAIYGRGLLREGLLDALKEDFVSNAASIPEIESLLDSPEDQVEFLRVLAAGQERAEKWDQALEAYLKLVKIVDKDDPLLTLEMGRSARLSHIVRGRLDTLRNRLSATGRERVRGWIEQEVLALQESDHHNAKKEVESFFFFFPDDSATEQLKRQWIARVSANVQSLRVMQELQKMRRSGNESLRRWATAEQAFRYDQLGLHLQAARCADELVDRWVDDICWKGKTGRECVAELSPFSRPPEISNDWPTGEVFVKKANKEKSKQLQSYEVPLPVKFFPENPSAQDIPQLWIEQRPQMRIYRVDPDGGERWSVPLATVQQRRVNLSTTSALNCARMFGDVLVVAIGGQVIAIDTLRARKNEGASAVLWRSNVLPADPQLRSRFLHSMRRGGPRPRWSDASPNQYQPVRHSSRLGPITDGGITFLRNRDLVSVDPLTGVENWTQKGLHPLSEVFGDHEHVMVLPPEGNELEIFSVIDGTKLGSRKVLPVEERWATVGAQILYWRKKKVSKADEDAWELALHDPWTQRDLWVYPVSSDAKATRVQDDAVAVFEKNTGQLVLLDLEGGEVLVDQMLDADRQVKGIYVLPADDSYLVVTNRGATYNQKTTKIQPVPQGSGSIFFSGQIVAIDRKTGALRWERPVRVEQWGLSLGQPPGLPILVLARRVTLRPPGGRTTSHVEMALIDKRSGREVVEKQKLPSRNYYFRVGGDRDGKMIHLLFRNRVSNFSLQLTDEPLDPEKTTDLADLATATSGLEAATRAVLDSLGRAMQLANEAALKTAVEKTAVEKTAAEKAAKAKQREAAQEILPKEGQIKP